MTPPIVVDSDDGFGVLFLLLFEFVLPFGRPRPGVDSADDIGIIVLWLCCELSPKSPTLFLLGLSVKKPSESDENFFSVESKLFGDLTYSTFALAVV